MPSAPAIPEVTATLLLVDDEPAILSALKRLFRPEGYRLLQAGGAEEALQTLERERVDLVLSDMRMPRMDGAALLEQVHARWPATQRLLLTGYADVDSTIAAINRGRIHRYVAKPWDDDALLTAVREALARQHLERENARLVLALQAANAGLEKRVAERTAEIAQVNAMLEAAYADLDQNFLRSLDVFVGLLELREHGAAGHSREVARLARRMAEHLKLAPGEVRDVQVAGLLHGIGKLSLPDELLQRPLHAMSVQDQARYRRHVLAAEAALMPLPALKRAARLVRALYERVDGQGSPMGLAGAGLPVAAQCVSLAYTFRGVLEGRLCEQAYTRAAAVALIASQAGTHFDPAVVAAFHACLEPEHPVHGADRRIDAEALRPGMVLARDLFSPRGTLLLAAGFRFDEAVVRSIRELLRREEARLWFHVIDPGAAPAGVGLAAPEAAA